MQTILVIDDDESLRDTIGLMLEKEGFRPILGGRTESRAWNRPSAAKPNLILVDLRMPGHQRRGCLQASSAPAAPIHQ